MNVGAEMSIQSLACTDVQLIRNCFNSAFSNYYIPLQLSKEQFAEKINTEAIDFKLSYGLFDDEVLAGFILYGIDTAGSQKISYNAGFGILPAYRGNKFSYLLYNHSLAELKKVGVTKILLEVVEQNIPAIKACQKMGFSLTRKLNSYSGRPKLNRLLPIEIKTLPAPNWEMIQKNCEWKPSWQYSTNCIKRAQSNYTLQVAHCGNEPVAYCIYNFNTARVAHFGCCDIEDKEQYLSALFSEINATSDYTFTSVLNVDTNALYANTFLLSIGLSRSATSCEMELSL